MSARNKLENKRKRRAEREARKAEFHRRYQLPAFEPTIELGEVERLQREARLAQQGFIVAHQEDMLWKPGDED